MKQHGRFEIDFLLGSRESVGVGHRIKLTGYRDAAEVRAALSGRRWSMSPTSMASDSDGIYIIGDGCIDLSNPKDYAWVTSLIEGVLRDHGIVGIRMEATATPANNAIQRTAAARRPLILGVSTSPGVGGMQGASARSRRLPAMRAVSGGSRSCGLALLRRPPRRGILEGPADVRPGPVGPLTRRPVAEAISCSYGLTRRCSGPACGRPLNWGVSRRPALPRGAETMLILSRKPGEAVVVGRPALAEPPRPPAPPARPTGSGSAEGGPGPAPCPTSAPAPGRRPGGAPPSRPGVRLGPIARRRRGPAPDVASRRSSAVGGGFRAV